MGNIGWPELVLLFVVALLLFGAKRLPEIGRSLGQAIKSFKDAVKGEDSQPRDGDKPQG
ncbi:MAG TPA: twin-arginine translocase TatA/TatE family subunit [Candidatus Edwardsbacteria bacterium]|nr:twin-arginine translocase TatA/TatE family subunit [Candidatus Edwardsbacteria bacterium]